jgi:superfamily II DNA or RNA helicase
MRFDQLLSRLDVHAYQLILGDDVVGTLNKLDSKYLYKSELNRVLTNTYTPFELLTNSKFRGYLLSLLRDDEARSLIKELGKSTSLDPWIFFDTYKFTKEDINTIFVFFDLPILIEDSKQPWINSHLAEPCYSLYPYQRAILNKINNLLESAGNRVLLHMPTGSGKTRTAMSFVCRHLIDNENSVVIWFANTSELLEQAYEEFLKAWSSLGNRGIQAYKFWGESNIDLENISDGFVVAGMSKAYSRLMDDIGSFSAFASQCSLVVMDEAHQAIAPTYQLLIKSIIVSNKASLIGLSATPGRTWNDISADKRLAQFFHRQKVKVEIPGYRNPVDYLVDEGYLAHTRNTKLLHRSGIKLSSADIDYLRNNYQLPDYILDQISKDQARNLLIISKVQELAKVHKRIILFGINKNHAILLNSLLTAMGLDCMVVTSDTPLHVRNEAIKNYKTPVDLDSNTKILCNFGILTTGFDAPETSCAVIARPTDSLVLYSQMVGRAIRGVLSGGNKEAEIVTVVDDRLPGFGSVAEAFENWDDVWNDL